MTPVATRRFRVIPSYILTFPSTLDISYFRPNLHSFIEFFFLIFFQRRSSFHPLLPPHPHILSGSLPWVFHVTLLCAYRARESPLKESVVWFLACVAFAFNLRDKLVVNSVPFCLYSQIFKLISLVSFRHLSAKSLPKAIIPKYAYVKQKISASSSGRGNTQTCLVPAGKTRLPMSTLSHFKVSTFCFTLPRCPLSKLHKCVYVCMRPGFRARLSSSLS